MVATNINKYVVELGIYCIQSSYIERERIKGFMCLPMIRIISNPSFSHTNFVGDHVEN